MVTETKSQAAPEEVERIERIAAWVKSNQRAMTIVAGACVVAAVVVWWMVAAGARREAFARRELNQARVSAESGNLPLAASDLSRITASFGRTSAGQEAMLLLGQVRLLQGQAALAATELGEFVAKEPQARYRAQAYDLLGAALEQTSQFKAAGEAYENGAAVSSYALEAVRLLLSAGRAFTVAGDTTSAARVYEQVVKDHGDSPAAAEAKVRLGELGRIDARG